MNLMLFLLSATITTAAIAATWQVQTEVDTPESAYFDPQSKMIFVSNISGGSVDKDGRGWIQALNAKGEVINRNWATGLNAPKGMRSHKNTLWVSDIDEVVAFDIPSGRKVKSIVVPKAQFLNDVAVSDEGEVFVSDMGANIIYRIVNDQLEVFLEGPETEAPNGLLVRDGKLVVAGWEGRLFSLDLKTKAKVVITAKAFGSLDGLELANDGSYLVSDWTGGKVYRVSEDGEIRALALPVVSGSADIGYVPESNLLLVPYMKDDVIEAFSL